MPEQRDDISAREIEVLTLIAKGHPNAHIGKELVITMRTVSNHVGHQICFWYPGASAGFLRLWYNWTSHGTIGYDVN